MRLSQWDVRDIIQCSFLFLWLIFAVKQDWPFQSKPVSHLPQKPQEITVNLSCLLGGPCCPLAPIRGQVRLCFRSGYRLTWRAVKTLGLLNFKYYMYINDHPEIKVLQFSLFSSRKINHAASQMFDCESKSGSKFQKVMFILWHVHFEQRFRSWWTWYHIPVFVPSNALLDNRICLKVGKRSTSC